MKTGRLGGGVCLTDEVSHVACQDVHADADLGVAVVIMDRQLPHLPRDDITLASRGTADLEVCCRRADGQTSPHDYSVDIADGAAAGCQNGGILFTAVAENEGTHDILPECRLFK